jgi:hypothetical protein
MPVIDLATGIKTATQIPLDDKAYIKTLSALQDLGVSNSKAFTYYDGLIVICVADKNEYIWRKALTNEIGVLASNFIYPVGSIVNEIDYSEEAYNFFLYKEVNNNYFDRIINGTIVPIAIDSLELQSSAIVEYIIGGQEYTALSTTLTLDDADATNDRFDIIVVNVNSEIEIKSGIPSINPQIPIPEFGVELVLSTFRVSSLASGVAGVSMLLVYNENLGTPTEFNLTVSGNTPINVINLVDTEDPNLDNLHISLKDPSVLYEIIATKSTSIITDGMTSLAMDIKVLQYTDFRINIKILLNNVAVGGASIVQGEFGIDINNTEYQLLNIPIEDLQMNSSIFDTVIITIGNTNVTCLLDHIRFIYGVENTPNANTYLGLQDTDNTYVNKEGCQPQVNNGSNALVFKKQTLHHLEDCMARKKDGNINYDSIESGDKVFFKEVDDNGTAVLLHGHTYDKDNLGNLNKTQKSSYTLETTNNN